ncbi:MAG TPA: GNAT family N-acetyltransferase [Ktedonobacteraceae bacterium]
MSLSPLIVRPLNAPEEYTRYYRLANTAFAPEPSEEDAQRRQNSTMQSPDFRAERVRGAFRDGQLLGGYTVHDRVLRMGAARLSIGGIGTVVTAPEARKQGVATALMQDALVFARENKHALLLLDGIPNFYFRYGYTDMFDVPIIEINRAAILAQSPSALSVRLATIDDVSTINTLYQRHFGAYTGSFERSLKHQEHRFLHRREPLLVAHTPQGEIEGYLLHGIKDEIDQGREVAANNWVALLALLRYHAELFDSSNAPITLQYFLPLAAPMTYWMIDTLEVLDASQAHSPAQEWRVRSVTHHQRFTGWMGCLTNFSLLMDSILPELQARWRRVLAQWTGTITLIVEGQTRGLYLNGSDLQMTEHSQSSDCQLELTSQELVQLIFGYRPLSQLIDTSQFTSDVRSVLTNLFPAGHTWMPYTDWF